MYFKDQSPAGRKTWLILCVSVVMLAAGCHKKDNPVYQPAGEVIRIGALLPVTGDGFSSGQAMQISLELARQDMMEYLASVGRNDSIYLEVADTKTDTAEALRQIKVFYEKGIRVVIGPYSSSEVMAIRSFAGSHGMLVVSPSSVAVSLAIPGDNIFRFVSCDRLQGEAMSKMMTEDKLKVIIPFIRDDLWGNDLLASTRNHFTQAGGSVGTAITYAPGTSGFDTLLDELDAAVNEELQHHNPNEVGVYMLSFAEGARILAEAKNHEHLNNVYWYGGSAFALNPAVQADTVAALFAYTHGLPCPIYGLDDAARVKWQPLRDRIQAQLGRMPDVYALTAYDAFWAVVLTFTATGPDPGAELFKSAFTSVSGNYFGATGSAKLDENGDRAVGNYDFWGVKYDTSGYCWKRIARYNSGTGILVRMTE